MTRFVQIFLNLNTQFITLISWYSKYILYEYTCRVLGILPSASSFALACLLFIILWYCLGFTYNGFSSANTCVEAVEGISCLILIVLFGTILKWIIYII